MGIVAGSAVVVFLLCVSLASYNRTGQQGFHVALHQAMAKCHFPGLVVLPYGLVLQGSLTCTVGMLKVASGPSDYLLGCLGFLVFVTPTALIGLLTTSSFPCVIGERSAEVVPDWERRVPGLAKFMALMQWDKRWDDISNTRFKGKFVSIFGNYVIQWFICVELTLSLLQGIVLGVRMSSKSVCMAQMIALLVLSIVFFALVVALRPVNSAAGRVYITASAFLQLLLAFLTMLSVAKPSSEYAYIIDYTASCATFLSALNTVATTFAMFVIELRRRGKRGRNDPHADTPAPQTPLAQPPPQQAAAPTQSTAALLLQAPVLLAESSDDDVEMRSNPDSFSIDTLDPFDMLPTDINEPATPIDEFSRGGPAPTSLIHEVFSTEDTARFRRQGVGGAGLGNLPVTVNPLLVFEKFATKADLDDFL